MTEGTRIKLALVGIGLLAGFGLPLLALASLLHLAGINLAADADRSPQPTTVIHYAGEGDFTPRR